MCPLMTPQDAADTEGPNASLQAGQATQMQDLARQSGLLANRGSQLPGAAAPPSAPTVGPAAAPTPQGPVQPGAQQSTPPPQPGFLSEARSINPPQPWRDMVRQWAAHPQAGASLKLLSQMLDEEEGKGAR